MPKLEIDIGYNKSFKWVVNDGVYFLGYLTENEISTSDVINFISTNDNKDKIIKYVAKLNGNYAIIVDKEDYVLLFTDIVRSLPIYYAYGNNKFIVTDDPFYDNDSYPFILNDNHYNEYLASGFVSGKYTLKNNFFQVQAGECIEYKKETSKISSTQYYNFKHSAVNNTIDLYIDELNSICTDVFSRLIKSLDNRQVVVPLSEGSDSRLIATMLKKLNYKNVVCFTYGKSGSRGEGSIAKQIAQKLGYKFYFIEYSCDKWLELYDNNFESILKYGCGNSSVLCVQPLIAMEYLKKNHYIDNDAVIIPGHAGDVVAGSHIPLDIVSSNTISYRKLINLIMYNHYSLNKNVKRTDLRKIIRNEIDYKKLYTREEAADNYENFEWKERQSKFISNDIRNYEFFSYQWRLPLWDKEIVKFWSKIPLKLRYNRNLYYMFENKYINSYLGMENKTISLDIKRKLGLKKLIKSIPIIDNLLHNLFINHSIVAYLNNPCDFYNYMSADELKSSIKKFGRGFCINTIILNKYIDILKGKAI